MAVARSSTAAEPPRWTTAPAWAIPPQRPRDEMTGLRRAAGAARQCAQVLQCSEPAFADDPLGGVADRGEHAPHRALVVVQGAVGVGPVGLLPVAVAVHRQQQVFRPRGLAADHHGGQHRADDVPDLGPYRLARLGQGRVLGTQQRKVRVVVEEAELLAPPHDHREPGGQADPAGGAQARRPAARISRRRLAPRVGTHPAGHLAITGKKHVRRFGALRATHRTSSRPSSQPVLPVRAAGCGARGAARGCDKLSDAKFARQGSCPVRREIRPRGTGSGSVVLSGRRILSGTISPGRPRA
jgi:hypothetical protein